MDTDPINNERFYGKMILTGLTELNNMNQRLNVTVNARTEEQSQLYLPLTSELTEKSSSFLHLATSDVSEAKRE
jgi:hypothetical protein